MLFYSCSNCRAGISHDLVREAERHTSGYLLCPHCLAVLFSDRGQLAQVEYEAIPGGEHSEAGQFIAEAIRGHMERQTLRAALDAKRRVERQRDTHEKMHP